jgi:hypothetical protein
MNRREAKLNTRPSAKPPVKTVGDGGDLLKKKGYFGSEIEE